MSRVAVLKGGRSLERQVSLRSGGRVEDALERLGHDVVGIDVRGDLVRTLRAAEPEVAFVALHGREGEDGTWTLLCPMTGLIRSIEVEEGQTVEPNALLIVIEAMKMNNEMRAQRGAAVRKIHVLPGDRIEQGADLITFGPID